MPAPLKNTVHAIFHAKVYEPVKRNKDGMRWIIHRFPIKGGISFREAMIREVMEPNKLFKLVRLVGGPDVRSP